MGFSENIAALEPSATMAISSKAKELIAAGRDIVNLSAGEPDFDTPTFISNAAIQAINDGKTRYTPPPGIPQLRNAVAKSLTRLSSSGIEVDPQGLIISSGAKQALFNVIFSVFGPGEEVLIPVPYWTTYPELVKLARAKPVFVERPSEDTQKVTVADLEAASGSQTRGLILNSPSNPSGAVYSRDELEEIIRWTHERGIWVLADEMYRRIYYGPEKVAPSVLDLPAEILDRVVLIDGASKCFAMTGWRMGFSYTTPELAKKISALQSQTTSNVTTPTQWAALAAYSDTEVSDREVERMRSAFETRKDLLVKLYNEQLPGVPYVEPEGAFYFWSGIEGLARDGEDSMAFASRLLDEAGVAVIPGAAFGEDQYFRMSFAYTEETLREAVTRLASIR